MRHVRAAALSSSSPGHTDVWSHWSGFLGNPVASADLTVGHCDYLRAILFSSYMYAYAYVCVCMCVCVCVCVCAWACVREYRVG